MIINHKIKCVCNRCCMYVMTQQQKRAKGGGSTQAVCCIASESIRCEVDVWWGPAAMKDRMPCDSHHCGLIWFYTAAYRWHAFCFDSFCWLYCVVWPLQKIKIVVSANYMQIKLLFYITKWNVKPCTFKISIWGVFTLKHSSSKLVSGKTTDTAGM